MQPVQEDDSKDGRYFPSDSEMPILIHYLQIYFSHPERSIQRSQVVQSVASILSPTNKHWNHRTIRLWFNNNKRVFYRPNSPQQHQEQNQIQPSLSAPTSFSQEVEKTKSSVFVPAPQNKFYLPPRSLSVMQVPIVPEAPPDHRQNQYEPSVNASIWERSHQIQYEKDTFAKHIMESRGFLFSNKYSNQSQQETEIRTTNKLLYFQDKNWDRNVSCQPCKGMIIDKESIPKYPLCNSNSLSFQSISSPQTILTSQSIKSASTPPSPPQPPGPIPNTLQNPTSNSPPPSPLPYNGSYPAQGESNSPQPFSPFPLSIFQYDLIESSTFSQKGIPFISIFNASTQENQIHFNSAPNDPQSKDAICSPLFSSRISSVAYDDSASFLWVHSGTFVRSFQCDMNYNSPEYDGTPLKEDQTISTGPHHSCRSAMTFWEKSLVLSSNSTILTLKPEHMYPRDSSFAKRGDEEEEESHEHFGVCLILIVPNIDQLATVNECLVVGSSDHHTAHIIASNGACVSRAIGHTAGITAMRNYDDNCFLTGSADQTVKFWDVRVPVAVHNMIRHKGIVTSVFGDAKNGSNLVLSGGTDGFVKVWDIRKMSPLFTLDLGLAVPQSLFLDNDEKVVRIITSEECKDYYYDLGKFDFPKNIAQCNFNLNSVLSFKCANE